MAITGSATRTSGSGAAGRVRRDILASGALAVSGLVGAAALARLWPFRSQAYQVVDRRPLELGGYGLFVALRAGASPPELKRLGEKLRREYADQKNMVVVIFDDAEAARTVRKGSRYQDEEVFSAALARQKATYLKNAATGTHTLAIDGEPPEVIKF